MGQCRDDVVGLISLNFFTCDIKGAGCVTGQGDLGAQILGHGIAVCFVLIIHVIAKCMAALVKNDRQMGGGIGACVALNIPQQHIAKPADRAHGQPIGFPRQRGQRMKGAKNKRRPIN